MHTRTERDQLKMGWLSMTEARLPPGFRFHPRDEELVCDYLEKKVTTKSTAGTLNEGSSASGCSMMIDVDLNNCEPWDLPDTARVGGREWYFFTLRDRKYATGQRTNRATQSGYWKATGKDQRVSRQGELVGMRKTLVFYQGRAPKGRKTNWVMHEFRMQSTQTPSFSVMEDWVLCRVFCKDKRPTSKPATELFHEATSSSSFPSISDWDAFDVAASSLEGDGQMNHCTRLPQSSISLQEVTASPLSLLEMTIHTTIYGERRGIPDFSSCDDGEVMKAVLCNYTEMEGKPKREPVDLDQRCCQESFLIDDGLLPIWSFFQCEQ